MDTVIITLRSPSQRGPRDLELPADVPLKLLLPELVNILELPQAPYQFSHAGQVIAEAETLRQAGVLTGESISLLSPHAAGPSMPRSQFTEYLNSALLCTPSGRTIALDNFGRDRLLVGRYDPRRPEVPDIDLSEEPEGLTISRRHAWLLRQQGQWVVEAISGSSPTRVGSKLLGRGKTHTLTPGDTIALGDVQLRFM